jgi:alkylhydroperoxidase family enzyme
METTCGRDALRAYAPEQANVLTRLEAGAWKAMRDADRVDLFDLASRAIALQHGLPALARPAAVGPSPWTTDQARSWRRDDALGVAERATLALAEQLAFAVASTQPDQREAFFQALGADAVPVAQAIFVADMLPRAHAALDALFGPSDGRVDEPDAEADLAAAVDDLIRLIPGLQSIDAVTTELVRLLGARRHACRVCQSVRSWSAMAAGADDTLFDAVERYETADYTPAQKAALAFADGMLSSPARFEPASIDRLARHLEPAARVELVLDVTRNATNKVAVALGGDAPRVETGYEIYEVKPSGEIEYGLSAP